MSAPAGETEQDAAAARIQADLLALGVRPGGVLLVHSSFKSLGGRTDPEAVIRGLLAALGPEGTLLLPALSYEHVTRRQPRFDQLRTPSNVGALPEYFRLRPGSLRSLHPTHSVCACGARAAEILSNHAGDRTPCGPGSPFHRLPEFAGQILMLGCGLRPNTSMHAVEEQIGPPYLFSDPIDYILIPAGEPEVVRTYTPHGFRGWGQRYDRVEAVLRAPGLRTGPVLTAQAHLLEAAALWDAVLPALRRDPLAFVERDDSQAH